MVLFLYVSTFFIDLAPLKMPETLFLGRLFDLNVIFGSTPISYILAALFLVLTAVSIFAYGNAFTTKINFPLPLIYMVMVLSNPHSCAFSPFHIVALLFIWALYYSSIYRSFGLGLGALFMTFFLIGVASLFYAPMVWLAVVAFILSFKASEEKLKYTITSLFALVIPFAVVLCTEYLIGGSDAVDASFNQYIGTLATIPAKSLSYTVSEIVRGAMTIFFTIVSLFFVVGQIGRYKTTTFRAYIRVLSGYLSLLLLLVLFIPTNKYLVGLLLHIPASLLIYEYLSASVRKRRVKTLIYLYFALLVAERIFVMIS